jgi:hypothetical protein
MFGGEINWAALPWVAEMKGCEDIDRLCELLVTVREHRREFAELNRSTNLEQGI